MKKFAIEIKWAIIYVILSIVWIFIQKSLGFFNENISKHLFYSILIALTLLPLFYLAQTDKKNNFLNGKMSWKQGFISGCIIIVMATLFSPLLTYLTYEIINPDFFDKAIEFYTKNGKISAVDAATRFNLKSYMMQSISDNLSFGIIFSAIIAFFTKSK
jgi:uncharacterized protein DUF4199